MLPCSLQNRSHHLDARTPTNETGSRRPSNDEAVRSPCLSQRVLPQNMGWGRPGKEVGESPIYLFIDRSIDPSIYRSVDHLSIYRSIYQSIYRSIHPSIHLSIRLSMYEEPGILLEVFTSPMIYLRPRRTWCIWEHHALCTL